MGIYITTDALLWEQCPQCKGEPQRFVEGYCDECGSSGEVASDLGWLVTLLHNLAIGAALCEAHDIALDEAESHRLYHEHGYRLDECWVPGCGKASP